MNSYENTVHRHGYELNVAVKSSRLKRIKYEIL